MLKLQIARGKGVYLVFLLFLLFAAGAIAAACGDDDDDEDVAATGEVKTGTVRIGEYHVHVGRLRPLRGDAGERGDPGGERHQ